jgi:hypothetical protein
MDKRLDIHLSGREKGNRNPYDCDCELIRDATTRARSEPTKDLAFWLPGFHYDKQGRQVIEHLLSKAFCELTRQWRQFFICPAMCQSRRRSLNWNFLLVGIAVAA